MDLLSRSPLHFKDDCIFIKVDPNKNLLILLMKIKTFIANFNMEVFIAIFSFFMSAPNYVNHEHMKLLTCLKKKSISHKIKEILTHKIKKMLSHKIKEILIVIKSW